MIEVNHYIAPRQTGKTRKAVQLFNEYYGPNTYMVVLNKRLKRDIIKTYNVLPERILIANKNITVSRIDTLIVDEFLLTIKGEQRFLSNVLPLMCGNHPKLFLFSTPNKLYTEDFVNSHHEYFLINFNDSVFINTTINVSQDPEYYDFRNLPIDLMESCRRMLNQTEFETAILGRYLENQLTKFYIYKPKRFSLKNRPS